MVKGKVVMLTALICLSMFAVLCSNLEDDNIKALNKFESYSELKAFLEERKTHYPFGYYYSFTEDIVRLADLGSLDYSKTNVQVEGVDEADITKSDGEYLYLISGQNVVIVRAYPPEDAAVLSRIFVNGTSKQLFINNDRLVVFYEEGYWNEAKTFIHVYDVSNRESPTLAREVIIEGQYFNSRMIDDYVYVIAIKSVFAEDDDVKLPKIFFSDEWREIPATEIYYSNIVDYAYVFTTIVASNVCDDVQEPTYGPILLGATSQLYVSLNNIYLAMTTYDKTFLYRIQIGEGEINYVADGQVPGMVLNQFSMDEYAGYFRITTSHNGVNSLYVLDMNLEIVGRLENVAPKEQIYSTRFMGKICYLVTFRKVDPFFIIDLSNPLNPRVLGELKISGYSDYLHLYDENHVIGVGKETVPASEGDFSWYQGVKISLFDVSDVYNPEEIAKYVIGERGTDSPVLSDHKAFLFDKEKNMLVLPVLVADIKENQYPDGVPPYIYGEPVWQGAYVFTVSLELEEKIMLRGTITHIENGDVLNSVYHITRSFYIGDFLYTISEGKVKINSLLDLSEINEINIKE